MGRFAQSFSKIDIYFSKGISENSKLCTDLYQKWKIVAAKKKKKKRKRERKKERKDHYLDVVWRNSQNFRFLKIEFLHDLYRGNKLSHSCAADYF